MNFKHLKYFWTVAKAGGVVRAGEQLHTTPQTLSGQIKQLEQWLGHDLFRKRGRGLELTSEGRVALGYAEQIFALGDALENPCACRAARKNRWNFAWASPIQWPSRWLITCWSLRWAWPIACT